MTMTTTANTVNAGNSEVYVTMNDLTAMLKISRTGILGLIKQGTFPQGIKLGKSRRWPLSEIQECLHSLAIA